MLLPFCSAALASLVAALTSATGLTTREAPPTSTLTTTAPRPASQGHGGGHQQESEAAAPVLKVGGKAKHPTLGHVTILVLGPLGAKIEFFSNVSQSIKERNVLLVDLEPLPDELLPDDIRGDSNGGGDADTTPAAEQARRPHESNTRALSAV